MTDLPIIRREISEFIPMPKIPRLHSPIVVTEKIDGTNASIEFYADGEGRYAMAANSRNRRLLEMHWDHEGSPELRTFGADNYGFGAWVFENRLALRALGYGRHFGEWWGCGIQRGYNLKERRFSLFRHRDPGSLPLCVSVVPTLIDTEENDDPVHCAKLGLELLRAQGSYAAPGFMNPEGVVTFHARSSQLFKLTFEPGPKGNKE